MKKKSEEALDTAKKSTKDIFGKVANSAVGLAGNAQKALAIGKDKAADAASGAKKEVVQRLDVNGDGQLYWYGIERCQPCVHTHHHFI